MKVSVTPQPRFTPSWELVDPSWRLVLRHLEPAIFLFVLPSLMFVLSKLLLGDTSQVHHLSELAQTPRQRVGIGMFGVGSLWSLLNFAPSVYFRLQIAAGKSPSLGTCYRRGLPHFWRLIGVNLLIGMVLFIGFVLFIVPGFILLLLFVRRYYLVYYYLVDRRLTIGQALRQSHQETAGIGGVIWGTAGVLLTFGFMAIVLNLITYVGMVAAIFLQLVCACLPALRYQEVKRAARTSPA